MAGLMETPAGERLTIGLFGRRNSGKTSLFNALLGQDAGIVSDTPGPPQMPYGKISNGGGSAR